MGECGAAGGGYSGIFEKRKAGFNATLLALQALPSTGGELKKIILKRKLLLKPHEHVYL